MNMHLTPLTDFARAIATGRVDEFAPAVRAAYTAGAGREGLLVIVDLARTQAEVPPKVVARAYEAVHAWHWIAARRVPGRQEPALQAA